MTYLAISSVPKVKFPIHLIVGVKITDNWLL